MNTTPAAGADPLAQLRALHLPEAVGAWPPAPGWWLLAALVATLLVAAVALIRRHRRSLRFRALRELDAATSRWSTDADLQPLATEISVLLRRVALKRFGRDRVAGLHGSPWREFLSQTARRSGESEWDGDLGRLLALAPYVPPGSAYPGSPSRDRLVEHARRWIRENS